MVSHEYRRQIALMEEFGDSLYYFEKDRFLENIENFVGVFESRYPSVRLSHSYKTNYTPALCRIAAAEGLFAEVVSRLEYDMALRCGYRPDRIIFNGPIKTKADLEDALLAGAMVNIDHLAEVELVCEVARSNSDARLSVGIRCNADFGAAARSRFGLSEEHGELGSAFEILRREPNLSVRGIHIHTSAVRTVESYRKRAEFCVSIVEKYFGVEPPSYLNLGGGFPSKMPPEISSQLGFEAAELDEYAETLCAPLNRLVESLGVAPQLILEPGIALFANVFRFGCRVLAVKRIGARNIAILSGGIQSVKPTGHGLNMPVVHLPKDDDVAAAEEIWDLTGPTCMEHDVLFREFRGAVSVGDIFVFDQVGAYTTVFKPPFIQPASAIVEIQGDAVRVLRQRETIDQILAAYSEIDE